MFRGEDRVEQYGAYTSQELISKFNTPTAADAKRLYNPLNGGFHGTTTSEGEVLHGFCGKAKADGITGDQTKKTEVTVTCPRFPASTTVTLRDTNEPAYLEVNGVRRLNPKRALIPEAMLDGGQNRGLCDLAEAILSLCSTCPITLDTQAKALNVRPDFGVL